MFSTFAKGKLMLTGEYVVLDGALSLAVPVKFGQHLKVETVSTGGKLQWTSRDKDGNCWFSAEFSLVDFTIIQTSDYLVAERLYQLLNACRGLNPDFCRTEEGYWLEMKANFPLNWGIGSSSTLIAALAKWADINSFQLSALTFGGSGYDLACAYSPGPIIYQIDPKLPAGRREKINTVPFDPPFKDELFFYYLGNKQDSREGIKHYKSLDIENRSWLVDQITQITNEVLLSSNLSSFEDLLLEHERLISSVLGIQRAQDLYFSNFKGVIKSLGAWGGDFVLSTRPINEGGIPYSEMVY